ncbi:acyltransferase family protein [Nonomuraea sp. NPDC050790]|uniref:acyltransferase family protein n=1 Tax=Nonomuraea sp. NPDC050790 TaxID=3364371 RepID=UPI0037A182B3
MPAARPDDVAAALPASAPPAAVATGTTARLAWLDALRGLGALAVVGEHLLTWAMPWLRPTSFNLGMYGVLVFFLVSGYIIPVSLERKGDVRAFWISRFFRLYPLYLAVIAIVLILSFWLPVRREVPRDPSALASHATMLLDVVGAGGLVNTMWTLSYEMVFYLLVAALFVAGVRVGRGAVAVAFAAAAMAAGLMLTNAPLTGAWLSWVSLAVFVLGLTCVMTGYFRTAAAVVLGVMALSLLLTASPTPWFGAAILSVMFAGTAIHRWAHGIGRLWPVAVAAILVALTPVWARDAGWWWVQPRVWITTIVLAAATFAVGMLLRDRRLPRSLVWLGVISYSLYLLHLPILTGVIAVTGDLRWAPAPLQIGVSLLCLLLILPASWLTYRYLERPMQNYARRLTTPP